MKVQLENRNKKLDKQTVITKNEIAEVLPKNLRNNISDTVVDMINEISEADSTMRETFRDNLIGYVKVMKEGTFKLTDYINAVRYVSYRLTGLGIGESWRRTFPDRYKRLVDEGASNNHISGFSTAYNKNKLVNLIIEQSLVPMYILNLDLYQEALNTQAELMRSANSEMVRTTAANSILTQLKQPEKSTLQIDMNINEGKAIDELREVTRQLAEQQYKVISSGSMNTVQVAHSKILKGEVIEE